MKINSGKATIYLAIATIIGAIITAMSVFFSGEAVTKKTDGDCSPIISSIGGDLNIKDCKR